MWLLCIICKSLLMVTSHLAESVCLLSILLWSMTSGRFLRLRSCNQNQSYTSSIIITIEESHKVRRVGNTGRNNNFNKIHRNWKSANFLKTCRMRIKSPRLHRLTWVLSLQGRAKLERTRKKNTRERKKKDQMEWWHANRKSKGKTYWRN